MATLVFREPYSKILKSTSEYSLEPASLTRPKLYAKPSHGKVGLFVAGRGTFFTVMNNNLFLSFFLLEQL